MIEPSEAMMDAALLACDASKFDTGTRVFLRKAICAVLNHTDARLLLDRESRIYWLKDAVAACEFVAEREMNRVAPGQGVDFNAACEQCVEAIRGLLPSDVIRSYQAAPPAISEDRSASAVRTLERLGYRHLGGELWKPPIGPRPAWLDNSAAASPVEAARLRAIVQAQDAVIRAEREVQETERHYRATGITESNWGDAANKLWLAVHAATEARTTLARLTPG